jgi:hypothetical protein
MKKTVLLACMIACYALTSANFSDTSIRNVALVFKYSADIFPSSWRSDPINAHGSPIAPEEIMRTENIAVRAIRKYPENLLAANLKTVYYLKDMRFYNTDFGGTNSSDNLYLTNDGIGQGYTDDYIEQTFHHEFSSILFRNHPEYLDTSNWNNANMPGFIYNDPSAGVGAIQSGQSSQDIDTLLCKKGILTQYALSALENDLNTIAQNLFCPDKNFWKSVDKYPKIKTKVSLLIDFYNKFSPVYSEAYFRRIDARKSGNQL